MIKQFFFTFYSFNYYFIIGIINFYYYYVNFINLKKIIHLMKE